MVVFAEIAFLGADISADLFPEWTAHLGAERRLGHVPLQLGRLRIIFRDLLPLDGGYLDNMVVVVRLAEKPSTSKISTRRGLNLKLAVAEHQRHTHVDMPNDPKWHTQNDRGWEGSNKESEGNNEGVRNVRKIVRGSRDSPDG
jgi:hypothetical protein